MGLLEPLGMRERRGHGQLVGHVGLDAATSAELLERLVGVGVVGGCERPERVELVAELVEDERSVVTVTTMVACIGVGHAAP